MIVLRFDSDAKIYYHNYKEIFGRYCIMPLVSDTVLKNAEICKKFVSKMMINIDKKSIIDEQKEVLAKLLFKAMCKVAPYQDDFEKVYGKKPFDYFSDPENRVF
jgi:hypothetical protein